MNDDLKVGRVFFCQTPSNHIRSLIHPSAVILRGPSPHRKSLRKICSDVRQSIIIRVDTPTLKKEGSSRFLGNKQDNYVFSLVTVKGTSSSVTPAARHLSSVHHCRITCCCMIFSVVHCNYSHLHPAQAGGRIRCPLGSKSLGLSTFEMIRSLSGMFDSSGGKSFLCRQSRKAFPT